MAAASALAARHRCAAAARTLVSSSGERSRPRWGDGALGGLSRVPARRYLVTGADVETYRRDGVVCLRGAFGSHWLEVMRAAFSDAMDRPGTYAEFIGKDTTWNTLFEAGAERRELAMFQDQVFFQDAVQRVPALADVALRSPAAEMIARLMGSTTAAFFYHHLIMKRGPTEQPIPWHQDLPYWKVDGNQIGSVWIALDDMPASANVRYVAGSHTWGLFRPQHFVDATPYEGRAELPSLPDVDGMLRDGRVRAVAFDVAAGDALCFDSRIVHGSPGGRGAPGGDMRRVALRFGGDDATYCDRQGETAILGGRHLTTSPMLVGPIPGPGSVSTPLAKPARHIQ
ncbi:unnamed protein product [Prorocentrum cordatum]|uniref:Phytanoyl-CoA dioxygenase n=1 Tax=Prorocentrum cordatum TaxID=2364126 RepID=A0ABN9S326_9DINO|nr:unnamed protein product [Polarella glacialis]